MPHFRSTWMSVSRTLIILWISLCFIRTTHGEAKTENVVLITTDGLRWQALTRAS